MSTGQGTKYDGEVSNDEEMSSHLYVSFLESNESFDPGKSDEASKPE